MIMSMYEYYAECSLMLTVCNPWHFNYYLFFVFFFLFLVFILFLFAAK